MSPQRCPHILASHPSYLWGPSLWHMMEVAMEAPAQIPLLRKPAGSRAACWQLLVLSPWDLPQHRVGCLAAPRQWLSKVSGELGERSRFCLRWDSSNRQLCSGPTTCPAETFSGLCCSRSLFLLHPPHSISPFAGLDSHPGRRLPLPTGSFCAAFTGVSPANLSHSISVSVSRTQRDTKTESCSAFQNHTLAPSLGQLSCPELPPSSSPDHFPHCQSLNHAPWM